MSDVLVIIPTYNEIENISTMLRTVMRLPDGFDVLVIDDGSPDGTADAVRREMAEYSGRIHLECR
ncbi:MAG: glycosyltransferase, partial [Muribaculaceae bacterium]|nr:glycosyltransferase [Muribaculaceae bacterium]